MSENNHTIVTTQMERREEKRAREGWEWRQRRYLLLTPYKIDRSFVKYLEKGQCKYCEKKRRIMRERSKGFAALFPLHSTVSCL